MIIKIVAPSVPAEIIKTVEAIEEPTFKFVKKVGINLEFECSLEDKAQACDIAKKALKRNPTLLGAAYSVVNY